MKYFSRNYNNPRYNVWLKSNTKFIGCDGWSTSKDIRTLIRLSYHSIKWWNNLFITNITDFYIKPSLTIFIHART